MNYMTNDKFFTPEQDALFLKNSYIDDGIEIGEKRGIEIGEKRGREIGEKRGTEKGFKETIKTLFNNNMPIETIAQYLNLPKEKVERIVSEKNSEN